MSAVGWMVNDYYPPAGRDEVPILRLPSFTDIFQTSIPVLPSTAVQSSNTRSRGVSTNYIESFHKLKRTRDPARLTNST